MRISGVDGTLKIELGNFVHSQRDDVTSFLRSAIPNDRQFRWDEFLRQLQDDPERKIRTRRVSWDISLILAFHAIAFSILGGLRFGDQCLLIVLVNAAFIVYFCRGTLSRPADPKSGELNSTPESRRRAF